MQLEGFEEKYRVVEVALVMKDMTTSLHKSILNKYTDSFSSALNTVKQDQASRWGSPCLTTSYSLVSLSSCRQDQGTYSLVTWWWCLRWTWECPTFPCSSSLLPGLSYYPSIRIPIVTVLSDWSQEPTALPRLASWLPGWVISARKQKLNTFLDLSDSFSNIQLQVVPGSNFVSEELNFRSCTTVQGNMVKSEHKGKEVELVADTVELLNKCDGKYQSNGGNAEIILGRWNHSLYIWSNWAWIIKNSIVMFNFREYYFIYSRL